MYEIFEKLCKEKGVTPYRVSEATGVKTSALSSWKAGRSTPKFEKMKLNISLNTLNTKIIQIKNRNNMLENENTTMKTEKNKIEDYLKI